MRWEDVVRDMGRGDAEAFSRFYDAFAPLAHGLILRIVRQPADAADVLQEVFWEAWRGAARYDPGRGTPEAWILNRARSRAIDRWRSVRRRGETFAGPADEGTNVAASPRGDPAGPALEPVEVAGALARLPREQRAVLELAYREGLTQTEIAERLRAPLGTVKTRMRLAVMRLREILGPDGP